MNSYVCYYKDKRIEVHADTTREAQVKAAAIFKAKKDWQVSVTLAALGGQPVIYVPVE